VYNSSTRIQYKKGAKPRKMENANISELMLLLEVTRIEDLAEKSSKRGDRSAREQLKRAARGFRNLVAHPENYGVNNVDLRRWAMALEDEFKRADKSSHALDASESHDPDASEVERDLAVELQNLDVVKLSAGISKNILTHLNTTQRRAFPDGAFPDTSAHHQPPL
jgi:hypothetical protein